MADDADRPALPPWLGLVFQVAAPATLLSALLFYFGYVYTQAYFWYFGLEVELVGLSTREVIQRSPLPLFLPLVGIVLVVVLVVAVRRRADARLAAAATDPAAAARLERRGTAVVLAGAGLVAAGLVLLVGAGAFDGWFAYPLVTPVLLAVGGTVAGLGLRYSRLRTTVTAVGVWVVVAAAAFWATSTVADALGRGAARDLAADFSDLPAVVVDSPVDLHLTNTVRAPRDLCVERAGEDPDRACVKAGGPRYRYTGLRVLVRGPDATFVVPARWDPHGSTVRLSDDLHARFQYQFVCDPPSTWQGAPDPCGTG
ncbi:hypothetical protein [Luteimicrobium sp. DT211]|uniref:hypothetical protein n=1 Tax=Luteimicrobium sp. DT211 TaxID=3393412 RepID=UPI003CF62C30